MRKELSQAIDNILKTSHDQKYKSLEDFSEQVLIDYILTMSKNSVILDYTKIKDTKDEIIMEIVEITKKKMYGFYDINEYIQHLHQSDA